MVRYKEEQFNFAWVQRGTRTVVRYITKCVTREFVVNGVGSTVCVVLLRGGGCVFEACCEWV